MKLTQKHIIVILGGVILLFIGVVIVFMINRSNSATNQPYTQPRRLSPEEQEDIARAQDVACSQLAGKVLYIYGIQMGWGDRPNDYLVAVSPVKPHSGISPEALTIEYPPNHPDYNVLDKLLRMRRVVEFGVYPMLRCDPSAVPVEPMHPNGWSNFLRFTDPNL